MLLLLLLILAPIVFLMVLVRYFASEQQSLLWMLTVAAEKKLPLQAAARAFAEERGDPVRMRARLLADYLEAGVPLETALWRSGHWIPHETRLAVRMAHSTGNLGAAMRGCLDQPAPAQTAFLSLLDSLLYLSFVISFTAILVTFMVLKILPVFGRMFDEFDLHLPAPTRLILEVSRHDQLLGPMVLLWLILAGFGVLFYIGISPRSLPLFRRLWWSADCALVMRWLAVAVRQQRPLAEMVRLLAAHFPQPVIRRRLARVSRRIDRGSDWCDALRRAGLIRRSESALFKSAARAGNLAWALDELADSRKRRAAYRLRAAIDVLLPVALLILAACVGLVALGVFAPLIALIQGLS